MAAILPFIHESVFDPDITHAMSVAFEDVCKALGLPETATGARQLVATRIIELARRGEHNPDRLRNTVLGEETSDEDGW